MTANDRNMKTTPEIALKELLESSNEVAIFFLAKLNISVDLNSKKTTASDKKSMIPIIKFIAQIYIPNS